MAIDTGKVTDRRTLSFATAREALADARALAAAENAGTLRRTGNWTLGEAFTHVAAFMNYPYDGYPKELKPLAIIRFLGKLMKNRFLSKPLPPGFRIRGIAQGTVGAERVSTSEGLARLEKAWARLEAGPPAVPNPVFGPLTHQEWINLHLRHSELHQSFMHPK
jgi:hypothetical protein